MTALMIEVKGLRAGYGQTTIVRGLDIEVRAGEIVALLGPNGAGKTTTILTLAGELPMLGGEIRLHGQPTKDPLYQRARAGLSLITDQKTVLMKLTVAENLRVNRGDVDLALALFPELTPHLKRTVGLLSGGQQQMLSLARALSRRPKILLADELSLGLAPVIVTRLLAAVRDAAAEGLAAILVEQHIHRVMEVADRAIVLRHGAVALTGDAIDLRADPEVLRRAYLGTDEDMSAVG